jgi:hypothetical protein
MDSVKNILVIVDPTSPDQPAVQKAGELASRLHASIELLACDTRAVDIMVMGAISRSHLKQTLIGSAASDCSNIFPAMFLLSKRRGSLTPCPSKEARVFRSG